MFWEVTVPGSKKAQAAAEDDQRRARAAASSEATELIAVMRGDLDALREFIAKEEESIERRGSSAKRLARLRLMADDIGSASKFAAKSIRS